jgi:hypothetical protein
LKKGDNYDGAQPVGATSVAEGPYLREDKKMWMNRPAGLIPEF